MNINILTKTIEDAKKEGYNKAKQDMIKMLDFMVSRHLNGERAIYKKSIIEQIERLENE